MPRLPFRIRGLTAALILLAAGPFSNARAEVVFPPGSRVGIEPLPDLTLSTQGPGFENAEKKVFVQVTEIPPAAYGDIERMMFFGDARAAGMIAGRPQILPIGSGLAYFMSGTSTGPNPTRKYILLSGQNDISLLVTADVPVDAGEAFSDEAMRRMLATATLRRSVPPEEQLAQMPFSISDLGGFSTMTTLAPRSAVMLTDFGPGERIDYAKAASLVIAVIPGAPERAADRGAFAEQALASVQGYRNSRVIASEPMRIGGYPGYEVRVEAIDIGSNTPVTIVQWMRFGSGGVLRLVGVAAREVWPEAYTRFRTVRDAIEMR